MKIIKSKLGTNQIKKHDVATSHNTFYSQSSVANKVYMLNSTLAVNM